MFVGSKTHQFELLMINTNKIWYFASLTQRAEQAIYKYWLLNILLIGTKRAFYNENAVHEYQLALYAPNPGQLRLPPT